MRSPVQKQQQWGCSSKKIIVVDWLMTMVSGGGLMADGINRLATTAYCLMCIPFPNPKPDIFWEFNMAGTFLHFFTLWLFNYGTTGPLADDLWWFTYEQYGVFPLSMLNNPRFTPKTWHFSSCFMARCGHHHHSALLFVGQGRPPGAMAAMCSRPHQLRLGEEEQLTQLRW